MSTVSSFFGKLIDKLFPRSNKAGVSYLANLEPTRWHEPIITYKIIGMDRNLLFKRKTLHEFLFDAVHEWNAGLGGHRLIPALDEMKADITIICTDSIGLRNIAGVSGEWGHTFTESTKEDWHFLESAKVYIDCKSIDAEKSYTALIHEIGHALGTFRGGRWGGHSQNKRDIMHDEIYVSRPSRDDIATMLDNYS